MKWSIFVCLLVCLTRFCEGLALKCPPGVIDPICTDEEKEEVNTEELSRREVTEAQCLAGTEWESNCHYCRCSESGVAECIKQYACDKEIPAEPVLCKLNTTFRRGCNTCVCLEKGLGLCTIMLCERSVRKSSLELLDESESERETIQIPPQFAAPIQNHREEENLVDLDHGMLKRSTICKPHQEFMRDCNPCVCASDGQSYSCTKNECLEVDMNKEVEVFMESEGVDHIERHSVCRASNTFYIGCNTCRCNPLGTDYSCTNKRCPLPADVELFHEFKIARSSENEPKSQVCVANRMFVKDCNTCWCNEDGTSYVCTRRTCVPLLPGEEPDLGGIPAEDLDLTKKQCHPDEIFEMGCNICRCNPDGESYDCTRRACEQTQDKKETSILSRKTRSFSTQETPKACQPGQEFRLDCNKCLCDNKGQDFSCTRIDCNALNNNHDSRSKRQATTTIEMKCVAGSVFNRDCNACRCTSEGDHAICSLKRCKQDNEVDNEVQSPESDLGFRCNPGEQFKNDCNDCTCSADGKSVFCTLRLCDQTLPSNDK